MPSQGCSEKAPDFSTFYHAGVHLRKVEARFLIQVTGGSSVLGRRTLRYHDTTLFFFPSLAILFNILEHQQTRITGSGRSTVGRATIDLPLFIFSFWRYRWPRPFVFLLLWPYTIGKLENSRYRGVRHGKKAQMRRRGLPLLEMEYIGIVAWNRPLRGWRETERERRKTKIGLKSREEGRKEPDMSGRLDHWPTQTAHSSGRGNWGFLGPFAVQS